MIDVTFTVNNVDWSEKLSTYTVDYEYEYNQTLTALDGTEYGVAWRRPIITFSLIPLTDEECASLYSCLSSASISVVYTDPNMDSDEVTGDFRLVTNLSTVFGLRSVDGNRYYKGSTLTFRRRTVI